MEKPSEGGHPWVKKLTPHSAQCWLRETFKASEVMPVTEQADVITNRVGLY